MLYIYICRKWSLQCLKINLVYSVPYLVYTNTVKYASKDNATTVPHSEIISNIFWTVYLMPVKCYNCIVFIFSIIRSFVLYLFHLWVKYFFKKYYRLYFSILFSSFSFFVIDPKWGFRLGYWSCPMGGSRCSGGIQVFTVNVKIVHTNAV